MKKYLLICLLLVSCSKDVEHLNEKVENKASINTLDAKQTNRYDINYKEMSLNDLNLFISSEFNRYKELKMYKCLGLQTSICHDQMVLRSFYLKKVIDAGDEINRRGAIVSSEVQDQLIEAKKKYDEYYKDIETVKKWEYAVIQTYSQDLLRENDYLGLCEFKKLKCGKSDVSVMHNSWTLDRYNAYMDSISEGLEKYGTMAFVDLRDVRLGPKEYFKLFDSFINRLLNAIKQMLKKVFGSKVKISKLGVDTSIEDQYSRPNK